MDVGVRSRGQIGTERVVDPDQMGRLFKILAITRPGLGPFAGFG